MRLIIFIFALLAAIGVDAQVVSTFNGKFNVTSVAGSTPSFTVTGVFTNETGEYNGTDAAVNDQLFVLYNSRTWKLNIVSFAVQTASVLQFTAIDSTGALTLVPTGQAAILRETPTYDFPYGVSGLRADLYAGIENYYSNHLDSILTNTGGDLSGPLNNLQLDTMGAVAEQYLKWDGSDWVPTYLPPAQFIDTLDFVNDTLSISLSNDGLPASAVHISAGGGIYNPGSGTVPNSAIADIPSGITFNTIVDTAFFKVTVGNIFYSDLDLRADSIRLLYHDIGGDNKLSVGPSGVNINVTGPDDFNITGTDARYGADYSGSFVDRSLIDKAFADSTYIGVTNDYTAAIAGQVLKWTGSRWAPGIDNGSGGSGVGEANVGANLGTGFSLYAGKVDTTLQFKSLQDSTGIIFTSTANEVVAFADTSLLATLTDVGAVQADIDAHVAADLDLVIGNEFQTGSIDSFALTGNVEAFKYTLSDGNAVTWNVPQFQSLVIDSSVITTGRDFALTLSEGNIVHWIDLDAQNLTLDSVTVSSTKRYTLGISNNATPVYLDIPVIDGSETSVTAGTNIGVTGTGTSGDPYVVNNTSPDQVVALGNGAGINVTGSYPNFTIASTITQADGSETDINAGTSIGVSGTGTSGDPYIITNNDPDQTVVLNNGTGINITGSYPTFTVNSTIVDTDEQDLSIGGTGPTYTLDITNGTSVTVSVGAGISLSEPVANELRVTNSAPDQTVVLNNGTGINVTGSYPNFTVNSTVVNTDAQDLGYTAATRALTITNGIGVTLPEMTNTDPGLVPAGDGVENGEYLKEDGTWAVPPNTWGAQTAQVTARLTGNGTGAAPLDIAQQGALSGEVLKWNGSSWAPGTDNTGGGGASGEANRGANLGAGVGIYAGMSDTTLTFKSLTEDFGINLTASATEILVGVDTAEIATLTDVGSVQAALDAHETADGDLSATNEIQQIDTFSLINNTLSISLQNDAVPAKTVNITGNNVYLRTLNGATYKTVQEMQNIVHSTGWASGGIVTDGGSGTVDVTAGTGLLKGLGGATDTLYWVDWAGTTGISLTDNVINYIYVDYNGGSPAVTTSTTDPTGDRTKIYLARIYRSGTLLHIFSGVRWTVGDHASLMMQSMSETMPFAHVSGCIASETGTRNLAVTAGKFWHGLTVITTGALNTSISDVFDYWYRDGVGGWTKVASQTQINNTQYDNNSGTLATLSNNRYGVHWIYIAEDDDLSVVYGRGDYLLNEAQDADPPDVPTEIATDSRIIAKVIIGKSNATFTSIESVFDLGFQGSAISGADVSGPGSSTDNAIVRFDGTTGKIIQNSGITIADGTTGTLSNTNTGDQSLFQTVRVTGQTDVVADATADVLTFANGTGIDITTTPATDLVTITNTAPDQVVALGNGAGINVTGSYPTFTIASTITQADGTETIVTEGSDIGVSGDGSVGTPYVITNNAPNVTTDLTFTGASSPFTLNSSDGTDVTVAQGTGMTLSRSVNELTITNAAPDQTVVLNNGAGINVTGSYPNFTVASTITQADGTETGVTAGTGIGVSGDGSSGTPYVITNNSPDQTVVLNNGTGISVTGSYPSFTITNTVTNTDAQNLTIGGVGPTYTIDIDNGTGVTIQGSGITLSESPANTLVLTAADPSATNEFQDLSYTAATGEVAITDGTNAIIPLMTNTLRGLVPDGDGVQSGEFLREDGTWQVPPTGNSIYVGDGTITGQTDATLASTAAMIFRYNTTDAALIIDDDAGGGAAGVFLRSYDGTGAVDIQNESVYLNTGNAYVGVNAASVIVNGDYMEVDGSTFAAAGAIRIHEPSGNDYIAQTVPALASPYTITWANAVPGGTYLLNMTTGGQIGYTDPATLTSTTDLSIEGTGPTYDIASSTGTDVTIGVGTGISLSESPPNTLLITNTAPDQTVVLSNGTGISASGTYPNFTITNTAPNVTTDLTFTGASSPYTLNSSDGSDVTIAEGTGITLSRVTNELTVTNSAPDQTVVLNNGTGINITGSYPTFTVNSTITDTDEQDLSYTASTGEMAITNGTSAVIPLMTNSLRGLVPDGDGVQDGEFLREDGTWATPAGGVGGSGTSPQVAYWSGASTLTGTAGFEFDGTNLGIGGSPSYLLDVQGTSSIRIPVGTTAQRPANAAGQIRVNTTDTKFEFNYGSGWGQMAARNLTETIIGAWTYTNTVVYTGSLARFYETNFTITDSDFSGRTAKFETSSISPATTRTYTFPDANGTLALVSDIVDNSVTNEAWTILADDAGTELISNQTLTITGGGIITTEYDDVSNTLTVTGAAADGSETVVNPGTGINVTGSGTSGSPYVITNTVTDTDDQGLTIGGTGPNYTIDIDGGSSVTISGSGITLSESPANTLVFTAVDASATNEIQNLSYTSSSGEIAIDNGGTNATITLMTNSLRGLVPDGDGVENGEFLREDGTWQIPPDLNNAALTIQNAANPNLSTSTSAVDVQLVGSTGITVTGNGTNVTFAVSDQSATNEIQNLGYTAATGTVTIDNGGSDAIIPLMTNSLRGLVPDGDGVENGEFLREDGTWAIPTGVVADADYGDITVSGSGTTWSIDAGVVSNTELASGAGGIYKGSGTAGTSAVIASTNGVGGAISFAYTGGSVTGINITDNTGVYISAEDNATQTLWTADDIDFYTNSGARIKMTGADITMQQNGGTIYFGGGVASTATRWYEPSGGGSSYVSIQAGLLDANVSLIWPLTGNDGIMKNISGQLSFGTIDVANLSTGTDGQIITWDVSGNPTTVGPGNAGEALVSNGSGAAPSFQTVAATSVYTASGALFSNGIATVGDDVTWGIDYFDGSNALVLGDLGETFVLTSGLNYGISGNSTAVTLTGPSSQSIIINSSGTLINGVANTITKRVNLSGDLTPAQLTASVNDYAPTGINEASRLRLSSDASRTITGIVPQGGDGDFLHIINSGSNDIVLADEDVLSSAANRFDFGGSDLTLTAGQGVILFYDDTDNRWTPGSYISAGGGGGVTGSGTANYMTYWDGASTITGASTLIVDGVNGRIAANTGLAPDYTFDTDNTDAIKVPAGSVAQRPTGAEGLIRFENDANFHMEYFNGAAWVGIPGMAANDFTSDYIPYVNSTGTVATESTFQYDPGTNRLLVPNIVGSASSGGDIAINSTDNITKGTVQIATDGSDVAVGTATPDAAALVTIHGEGTTSATFPLLIENSAGTDRFRVTDEGKIAIGNQIAGSTAYLQVNREAGSIGSTWSNQVNNFTFCAMGGSSTANANLSIANYGNNRGVIFFNKSEGTAASPTAAGSSNANVGSFIAGMYDGGAFRNTASLEFQTDGSISSGNAPARVAIQTGATTSRTERFVVNSAGNVGINDTSPDAKLDIVGDGTTSSTIALRVEDSAGNDNLLVQDDGKVAINVTSPTANLDINGDNGYNQLRLRTSYTPTSSADSNGNTGDIAWDTSYIYVKTGSGWLRAALSSF